MPAETLEDAYNALDPRRPITPEQVDRLFVTRPNSPVRKIEAQLELSDSRLKLLFVGHRGSGKSSEMAYLSTLTAPHPSVIYSFPVAMRYDNDFKEIEQGFDDVHMLPNVALKHRDGLADDTGWETMVRICQRRVAPELFAEGVTDRAITLSGGHVKSFIQLMQQAVLNAVVDEAEIVQLSNLKEAQRAMRDDYIVLLRREQIRLLRLLRDDPDKDLVDITPEKQALLSNGSLLEYADERGPWADVTPVVLELLDRDWA